MDKVVKIGDRVLREKAIEVNSLEEAKELIEKMVPIMIESEGVGLAAPQIGISKRFFIFAPEIYSEDGDGRIFPVINPEIVDRSNELVKDVEGCLSIPGISGIVERSYWIKVRYQILSGETIEVTYEGFYARVFQHEFDHLNGILYIDHIDDIEDIMI